MTSNARENLVAKYCAKKKEHDTLENKVRESRLPLTLDRFKLLEYRKEDKKYEQFLKNVMNTGEMIGEVLKEDEEKERCRQNLR
jgi:hypothetical protein